MDRETAAALAIFAIFVFLAIWNWNERARRIPLEEFGLDAVKRVLRWESDRKRREILVRGWMTRHEWTQLNKRQLQAIQDELKRRGVTDA
jgi:acyl carrier protein phosphodiesterase